MRPRLSFRMAYRHVRAGLNRMVLSVLALALGVALVVAIQLMNAAVLESFLDTVDGMAGRAALTVSAGEGLTFDEGIASRVAAVPGVSLAVPLVTSVAFPDDRTGELLTVHGVDLGNDDAVRVYHRGETSKLIDDVVAFLNSRDSIIIGRELAVRRGLQVGDSLDLVTPTGVKRFVVRGLLDPEGLAKTLEGRLVVMDIYAAELAFTSRGQINQLDLLVGEGQEAGVKKAVEAILPPGLKVEEPRLRKEVVRRTVSGFQAMLSAFALLAVLAGFLICYSRLAAIFEGRTWEVGLLRAVGLSRVAVFAELLKESLLLGGLGTMVGLCAGVLISRYGLPAVASATAINFRLPVAVADASLERGALLMGALVGLGAAVLAALVPAVRLARKQPIAALTMRGRELVVAGTRRRSLGWVVACAAAAVGLALLQRRDDSPLLGNLTTLAVVLTVCAAAGPLVTETNWALKRLWRWLFGPAGRFAAWHLRENTRRAAFMVATIGVGLGVVYMFGTLGWSFERTLVERITGRTRADLTITSAYVSGGYQSAPIPERVRQAVLAIPGVAAAAGQQRRDIPHGGATLTVDGFDTECFRDERMCRWVLDAGALPDALGLVASGAGALVTGPLARQLGVQPGDVLELSSPTGPQRLQVAAITRSDVASVVVISRDRLRMGWNDDTISWLFVVAADPAQVADVHAAIARALGQSDRLLIRTRAEFVQYLADQARQAFSLLYIMEAVVFLLVLIGIGDTLATSVLERMRELGMMRAVGLRRSDVVSMVVLEAGGICMLGLALAALAGGALGVFWVQVQFPLLVGWGLELHLPGAFVITGALLTLALCLAGALFPSLRAAHVAVPMALRGE
jgi:putative ABC transport system permease protein